MPYQNPIEVIEELAEDNGWSCFSHSKDEVTVEHPGQWCDYAINWHWDEETQTLGLASTLNLRVPEDRLKDLYELLALVNDKVWLGHFELASDQVPTFRHTILLRGIQGECTSIVEDAIEIAVAEAERFYPVFQLVIWEGKKPADALTLAMLDAMGEA